MLKIVGIFVSLAFLIISITLIISIFVTKKVNVSVKAAGVTATIPQATFFIPAMNPLKFYVFKKQPEKLSEILDKYAAKFPGTLGVYIYNLNTHQEAFINPDERFPSASLYKLGIMYSIYKLGFEKKLDLNKPEIKNNLSDMITFSSNEAAYYLVNNYATWNKVTSDLQKIGLKNTSLNQDPPFTTPRDIGSLLSLIADGKALNLEASVSMLDLMSKQTKNDRIPVLLPKDLIIAHKTGELDDVRHDAGIIVGPNNDTIVVLMSKGSTNPEAVKPIMSDLTKEIYDFFEVQWNNPPEIL
jgi:beta-lactamase class A